LEGGKREGPTTLSKGRGGWESLREPIVYAEGRRNEAAATQAGGKEREVINTRSVK